MIEVKGNIWDYEPVDYRIITTNGFVTKQGRCVMGRGVALQAKNKFTDIDLRLGSYIRGHGNNLSVMRDIKIITFPVKHIWKEPADLRLIKESTTQLGIFLTSCYHEFDGWTPRIVMPRPGCGNGGLDWESQVKPIIEILPDNILVINLT